MNYTHRVLFFMPHDNQQSHLGAREALAKSLAEAEAFAAFAVSEYGAIISSIETVGQ